MTWYPHPLPKIRHTGWTYSCKHKHCNHVHVIYLLWPTHNLPCILYHCLHWVYLCIETGCCLCVVSCIMSNRQIIWTTPFTIQSSGQPLSQSCLYYMYIILWNGFPCKVQSTLQQRNAACNLHVSYKYNCSKYMYNSKGYYEGGGGIEPSLPEMVVALET